MAREDKPYRVYRGGRATGGVPTLTRPPKSERRKKAAREAPKPRRYTWSGPAKKPRRFSTGRIISLGIVGLVLLLIGWTVAGYLSVRRGVEEANDRLGEPAKAQLTPVDGWMLSEPSTTLIVGSDHSAHPTRRGNRLADSLMLLAPTPTTTDHLPLDSARPRGRSARFSHEKINSTLPNGGAALTIRTIREASASTSTTSSSWT